jgi:hypothetical protein
MNKSKSNKSINVSVLAALMFYSNPAFAYLDPGSGSAIVGAIMATVGSIWFSIKSLFYRFKGKADSTNSLEIDEQSLVLFNEGKAYWGTFRPLINELIERQVHFRYFTLDLYDPALEIDSEYMKSRRLSLGSINMSEINNVKAQVVISTTPNIGCKGYPVKKSPNNKKLIHIFHHVGDVSIYKKHSLDFYDEVILVGDFQEVAIRELEKKRALKPKQLVSLGALYLDDLVKNKPSLCDDEQGNTKPTILVGSSWGAKGCLQNYGTKFITHLADSGFNIIVRSHPQSEIIEPEFIEECQKFTTHPNIKWDKAVSPSKAMHESDLLISDTSALRFDYAFLYQKPIITLDINKENLAEFEQSDLSESWYDGAALQIGTVVNNDSISEISAIAFSMLNTDMSSEIKIFREKTVNNFGKSAPSIVKHLCQINGIRTV